MPMRRPSHRSGESSPKTRSVLWETTSTLSDHFDAGRDFDPGHTHSWRTGDARTSVDAGHSHRVVLGRIQPNKIDGHTHTLAGQVEERSDWPYGEGASGRFVRKSSRRDVEET